MTSARADIARMLDPYRSDAERYFAEAGYLLLLVILERDPAHRIERLLYEPLTIKLPGGVYTPDFLAITTCGEMIFVEVKGSTRQKNYRDARSKLRAAAELHPYWTFVQATGGRRDGFEIEEVQP